MYILNATATVSSFAFVCLLAFFLNSGQFLRFFLEKVVYTAQHTDIALESIPVNVTYSLVNPKLYYSQ